MVNAAYVTKVVHSAGQFAVFVGTQLSSAAGRTVENGKSGETPRRFRRVNAFERPVMPAGTAPRWPLDPEDE
jgi:hypothetical protein